MLKDCNYRGEQIAFYTDEIVPNKNIFTVIVGKNGTGKSRLLKSIVERFVDVDKTVNRQRPLNYFEEREDPFQLNCNFFPKNIVALSTSPFDKFPITRETKHVVGYEYLGLRGLNSQNLSISFMGRILGALLRSISENSYQAATVTEVLNYLGYEGYIEARLVAEFGLPRLQIILESGNPLYELMSSRRIGPSSFTSKLREMFERDPSSIDVDKVLEALDYWLTRNKKPRLDILIDASGAYNAALHERIDEPTLLLYELGFFRLRDVALQKHSLIEKIRISDASSGEQCVVMALLGIASHIQNGSLICIDEPEICLHPEWQEKYIELLMATFGSFSNCHFVIATHSPQIVSKLKDENCFVLDLESAETIHGKYLSNRSADFQLASIFKAPGYKNEYLSRELIRILATLSSGMALESGKRDEISKLLSLRDLLDESDPVRELMEMLETVLGELEPR